AIAARPCPRSTAAAPPRKRNGPDPHRGGNVTPGPPGAEPSDYQGSHAFASCKFSSLTRSLGRAAFARTGAASAADRIALNCLAGYVPAREKRAISQSTALVSRPIHEKRPVPRSLLRVAARR